MRRVLLEIFGIFRTARAVLLPPSCRFVPTCSEYAHQAVTRFGVASGAWLTLRRLLRCHPFHSGGLDPVPSR